MRKASENSEQISQEIMLWNLSKLKKLVWFIGQTTENVKKYLKLMKNWK